MKRIQRKRTKGFKMPPNTIYVGRGSRWGNPFKVGIDGEIESVIMKYRLWLIDQLEDDPSFLKELKGKNLACWCALDKSCHADVLLEKLRRYN